MVVLKKNPVKKSAPIAEDFNSIGTVSNKPKLPNGYRVTVGGQYYTAKKTLDQYRVVVKIPERVVDVALSVIKNKLLEKALKLSYPDAKSFRTYEIISFEPLSENTKSLNKELRYMSRREIKEFCVEKNIEILFEIYRDMSEIRQAVSDALEDYTKYKEKETKLGKEREIDVELNALNEDLLPSDEIL